MNNELYRMLVKLAVKEARNITDDTKALEFKALYKEWDNQINNPLTVGEYVQYNNVLYKVLQDHTVQENWTPTDTPSLFAKVLTDLTGETILEWEQPDSTNPYMTGDKVMFGGVTYESLIDNNTWSPSEYPAGWQLV